MHVDDVVPVLRHQLVKARHANDAGVVDHEIDLAERVARALDDFLRELPSWRRCHCWRRLAACRLDVGNDFLRWSRIVLVATEHGAADVVDDDLRTFLRQQPRNRPADRSASAGDDRDLALDDSCHPVPLGSRLISNARQSSCGHGGVHCVSGQRPCAALFRRVVHALHNCAISVAAVPRAAFVATGYQVKKNARAASAATP